VPTAFVSVFFFMYDALSAKTGATAWRVIFFFFSYSYFFYRASFALHCTLTHSSSLSHIRTHTHLQTDRHAHTHAFSQPIFLHTLAKQIFVLLLPVSIYHTFLILSFRLILKTNILSICTLLLLLLILLLSAHTWLQIKNWGEKVARK